MECPLRLGGGSAFVGRRLAAAVLVRNGNLRREINPRPTFVAVQFVKTPPTDLLFRRVCGIMKPLDQRALLRKRSTVGLLLLTQPTVGVLGEQKQVSCMRKEVAYGSIKNRQIYC